MRTKLIRELPMTLIMMIPLVFLMINWNSLPEQLPTHWNMEGEIDGYGPKWSMPLLNLGIYLLLLVAPRIDPRKKNYDLFSGTYYKVRLVLTLFFSAMSVIIMMIALGADIKMERFIAVGVSILFTVLGNYMGTIRPNYFFGIRTPWTLDNEEVWRRTHILGGRFWFWGGLACLAASLILPNEALVIVLISILGTISLVPVIYSYVLFRKIKNSHS
jgi:uncharacterized membrane protein